MQHYPFFSTVLSYLPNTLIFEAGSNVLRQTIKDTSCRERNVHRDWGCTLYMLWYKMPGSSLSLLVHKANVEASFKCAICSVMHPKSKYDCQESYVFWMAELYRKYYSFKNPCITCPTYPDHFYYLLYWRIIWHECNGHLWLSNSDCNFWTWMGQVGILQPSFAPIFAACSRDPPPKIWLNWCILNAEGNQLFISND